MNIADVVRRVHSILRHRPDDFFPIYFLGAAIPAVTQMITIIGLIGGYVYLGVTGRLDRLQTHLSTTDIGPPPEPGTRAFTEWANELLPILELIFPPGVLVLISITLLASLVTAFVLYSAVTAGQLAVCLARIHRERALPSGLAAARKYWVSFLGLYLFEAVIWILSAFLVLLLIFISAQISFLLGGVVALFVVPFWIIGVTVTRAIFVFAPVAVVVDEISAFTAVKTTISFIRHHPADALVYYSLAITVLVLYSGIIAFFSTVGSGSVVALGGILFVSPVLDIYKTTIFANSRGSLPAIPPSPRRLRTQIRGGLRRGWSSLISFVLTSPGYLTIGFVLLLLGAYMGWLVAEPFTTITDASIESRIATLFPVTAALEFFGNNWSVAFTIAYAGLVFGLPSAVLLWVNGVSIGVLYQLEINKPAFVGFVTPHGIIEIPSIVIAGALGLKLGVQTWKAWRTDTGKEVLTKALARMFWIVVGLGILLAIAGFIEGFISPFVARIFA